MSDKLFDLIIYKFHQPWCTAYSEMEHYQIHTVFPQDWNQNLKNVQDPF